MLSVQGDDVFLLADKHLDYQDYNDTQENTFSETTWETCTIRSWLNGYGAEMNKEGKDYSNDNFLENAFSADEQSAIKTTSVANDEHPIYMTEGGNDTADQVYLLSLDEVMNPAYGFISNDGPTKTREALNTAYATAIGEYVIAYWWLRSPGLDKGFAMFVCQGGDMYQNPDFLPAANSRGSVGARPALHLNLSAASGWSYAGTVSSGTEQPSGTDTPTTPAPENTQKPQGTAAPGTPSQPGSSLVISSVQKTNIPSDPGKGAVGKVSALKLKQKKRTVTASWKKVSGASGYQICYSTSKDWKGKKQKTVTQNKVVIKKLKKDKTYYFRIRAYRMEGTKKVYGAWGSVKKIRIKK